MSDKPSNAKKYALRGLGAVLTTVGAGLAAHVVELGQLMQSYPSATTGIAAGVGAILYGWGLWTWELKRKLSKTEQIKEAREAGRPICDCTTTGEIMLLTPRMGSADVYRCPACGNPRVNPKPNKHLRPLVNENR